MSPTSTPSSVTCAALAWRDGGYVAEVDPDDVDVHRFERFVERAAALAHDGRLLDAAGEVEAARALWRGRPLGGLADELPFAPTVARLEERAAQLEELAMDVRLARGEAAELVVPLTDAVATQPFRERCSAQLALALYRAGRPVDALRSIEAARSVLHEEVGVDPGPELLRLQHAILDHDPSLLWRPPIADTMPAPVATFVGRRSELERLALATAEVGSAEPSSWSVARRASGRRRWCERGLRAARAVARCLGPLRRGRVDAPYGAWSAIAGQLTRLGVVDTVDLTAADDPVANAAPSPSRCTAAGSRSASSPSMTCGSWADAGTLGVLELLADQPPAAMLLVATVRARCAAPGGARLRRRALTRRAVRIDLAGLGVDDVERWIAAGPDRVDVARRVHDRTGGHPFFIREIVALIGAGDGGTAALSGVPAAVHDVVRRRVGQLPPAAQQLLAAAAVLGRHVDLGVLAGVVEEPIEAVLDALDPAVTAGLLEADPGRIGQLQFAHAIVAEALRDGGTTRLVWLGVTPRPPGSWSGAGPAISTRSSTSSPSMPTPGRPPHAASAVEHRTRAAELAMVANTPGEAAAHLARRPGHAAR